MDQTRPFYMITCTELLVTVIIVQYRLKISTVYMYTVLKPIKINETMHKYK